MAANFEKQGEAIFKFAVEQLRKISLIPLSKFKRRNIHHLSRSILHNILEISRVGERGKTQRPIGELGIPRFTGGSEFSSQLALRCTSK